MILKYPEHFYEPMRIEIAVSQMRHDLRKLFCDLTPKELEKIDQDIADWFEGKAFELEKAHDFWNFFGGFARDLKLKSLLNWLTAENVTWQKQDVLVDDIFITWDFPQIHFMPKAPYLAGDVRKKLNSPSMEEERERIKKDSELRSRRFAPRDQFPVVLFFDAKGGVINHSPGYYLLEGNRRTVKAITDNEKNISAYVGQFKNPDDLWPRNYWVRTGVLRDLIFLAIGYQKEKDRVAYDTIRKMYQLYLRDFEVARIATFDKSFKTFETSDQLILDIFKDDLR